MVNPRDYAYSARVRDCNRHKHRSQCESTLCSYPSACRWSARSATAWVFPSTAHAGNRVYSDSRVRAAKGKCALRPAVLIGRRMCLSVPPPAVTVNVTSTPGRGLSVWSRTSTTNGFSSTSPGNPSWSTPEIISSFLGIRLASA